MPSYKNKTNNIEMETIPKKGFNKIYFSFCLFQLFELHPFKVLQKGKSTVLILLFFLTAFVANARHIAGGEMSYKYIGIGSSGKLKYEVLLKLYRDCFSPGAALDGVAAINVFNQGNIISVLNIPMKNMEVVQLSKPGPCIENAPIICYEIGYYSQIIELPVTTDGYILGYQSCCRIENITNVSSSGSAGVTYMAAIPGTKLMLSAPELSESQLQKHMYWVNQIMFMSGF